MEPEPPVFCPPACPDDAPGAPVTLPFVAAGCPGDMRDFAWELARFLRIDKIDSGFASHVYKVVDTRTNKTAALKVYDKRALSPAIQQAVMQEISIHGRLTHPHLVNMFAAFEDGPFLCIVMELAVDGSLYRRLHDIKRSEEAVAKYILGPLLSVLAYMHSYGIIHRDLKPENILLRSSHILLSDLGFAVNVTLQRPVTQLGTMHFMAPEICVHDPWDPNSLRRSKVPRAQRKVYGPAVDVWAVGCVAYELLCKQPLFKGRSEEEVLESIINLTPSALPETMSPEARDFLAHCLVCEPEWRATAEELYSHEFIVKHMGPEKHERLDPERFLECNRSLLASRTSGGHIGDSPGSYRAGSILLSAHGSAKSGCTPRPVWGPSTHDGKRKAILSQVPMMASDLIESSGLSAMRRRQSTSAMPAHEIFRGGSDRDVRSLQRCSCGVQFGAQAGTSMPHPASLNARTDDFGSNSLHQSHKHSRTTPKSLALSEQSSLKVSEFRRGVFPVDSEPAHARAVDASGRHNPAYGHARVHPRGSAPVPLQGGAGVTSRDTEPRSEVGVAGSLGTSAESAGTRRKGLLARFFGKRHVHEVPVRGGPPDGMSRDVREDGANPQGSEHRPRPKPSAKSEALSPDDRRRSSLISLAVGAFRQRRSLEARVPAARVQPA